MKKYKLMGAAAKVRNIVSFVIPAIAAIALAGTAQATTSTAPITISSVQDLQQSLCNVFGWMFVFLIGLSSVMAAWAAFMYVTANGDAEKVSKAGKTLMYVAIGVGVALLARAIPLIVGSFFGVGSSQIGTC